VGDRLVVVRDFLAYGEARMVAELLRDHGMRAVLPHDPSPLNRDRWPAPRTRTDARDWVVEVLVDEDDLARARELTEAFLGAEVPQEFRSPTVERWAEQKRRLEYQRRQRERRKLAGFTVGVVVFIAVMYVLTQAWSTKQPLRAGIVLDEAGRPELVTAVCPGASISSAQLADASQPTFLLWSAQPEHPGVGRRSLPLLAPVDGYRVLGRTGGAVAAGAGGLPAGRYEVHVSVTGSNTSYTEAVVRFSTTDLRPGRAVIDTTGDAGVTDAPAEELTREPADC
jgi:hypothetical protein